MKVYLRSSNTEDKVVGLKIETSFGRRKRIFSYDDPRIQCDPHLSSKWLECKEGYEVVGFHGIFSVSINTIALRTTYTDDIISY